MKKIKVSSNTKWEDIVGYSRAVRMGMIVEVAGTTAVDGDTVVAVGKPFDQAIFIFDKIEKALLAVGATLNDVIRTRIYVKNMDDWEAIGRAHGIVFGEIKPVATMIEVSRFIDEDILLEVEVSAVVVD